MPTRQNLPTLGPIVLLPSRNVRPRDGFDDGGTWIRTVQISSEASRLPGPDIRDALSESFSHWATGCHHSYDCCGCELVRTTAHRISRRKFVLRTDVSFNY